MEKPEHIDRMQTERSELEERIAKAQTFLDTIGPDILNRMQVMLLNIQLDAMRSYLRVLNARIEYDLDVQREDLEEQERVAATLGQDTGDADASES